VTARKHEAVAVKPLGVLRVVLHEVGIEHSADLFKTIGTNTCWSVASQIARAYQNKANKLARAYENKYVFIVILAECFSRCCFHV
jgi:hypothetical protein